MGLFDAIGGLVGGALSFLGGERRNDAMDEQADQANEQSAAQAQLNREFSAAQAERQMQFQGHWAEVAEKFNREMSNSAYQRATADMKLAGINPMLAYQRGGSSAAPIGTPSGAAGQGSMPTFQVAQMENTLGPAVATALQGFRTINEVEQLQAQVGERKANTALLAAQEGLVQDQANNLRAHTAHTLAQLDTPAQQRALMIAQAGREGASAGQLNAQADQLREQLRQLQQHGRSGFSPGDLLSQGDAFLQWLQGQLRRAPGAAAPGALPTNPPANRGGNPGNRMVNPIPGY